MFLCKILGQLIELFGCHEILLTSDEPVELFGITESDDLLVILGHLLENENHLFFAQRSTGDVLLGETGEEISVRAGETNPVIFLSGLNNLLLLRLVFRENPSECFERPRRIGRELTADISGDIFLGQLHTGNTDTDFIKVEPILLEDAKDTAEKSSETKPSGKAGGNPHPHQ